MRRLALCLFAAVACGAASALPAAAGPGLFVGAAEDAPKWEPDRAFPPARDLGIKAFRISLMWEPGQTEVPPARVEELDRAVSGAAGIRIVLAVYANRAYKAPVDAEARTQYCAYVRDALARYPAINDVVIWNEPNLTTFWRPQFNPDGTSASPQAYLALLARCYDVLHAFRPELNVIAPSTSPRGNDDPTPPDVSPTHSPVNFIRRLGEAYRASGRQSPILDTVGQVVYGATAGERPWKKHVGTRISQGDWDKLMQTYASAFGGSKQPLPGACTPLRCVGIWYMEAGYQTTPDPDKAHLYVGGESSPTTFPDYAGGEPDFPPPGEDSRAPDQATQLTDGVRLAYCQPHVEAFFNFLLRDEADVRGWQSGVLWTDWTAKDSFPAFKRVIGEVDARAVDCSKLKGGPPGKPANETLPTISGSAAEGATLWVDQGRWRGWEPPAYDYRWQRCDASGAACSEIAGATASTYVLGASDVGRTIRVVVAARNSAGTTLAISNATAVVAATTPAVSVADVTASEGALGAQVSFFVSLARAHTQPVTVAYASADGTATAPADYAPVTGTLTFAPGETTKPVPAQIASDTLDEPDETFFLELSNASNATLGRSRAVATIVDDDAPAPSPSPPPVTPSPVTPPPVAPPPPPPAVRPAPVVSGSPQPRVPRRADTRPPRVEALAGVAIRGRRTALRYRVSDESGVTREQGFLYRRGRLVARMATRLRPTVARRVYRFRWRGSRRRGALTFCVRAWDSAGNAGARSCARVRIAGRRLRRSR